MWKFVVSEVGEEVAPKITAMIIDLPIEDLKLILESHSLLLTRIAQAAGLLGLDKDYLKLIKDFPALPSF